jgi:hypothetical protein
VTRVVRDQSAKLVFGSSILPAVSNRTVTEWFKVLPWKGRGLARAPRVRIPPVLPNRFIMKKFWCNGCGEPKYKCYCDEQCPTCDKKLKDCIGESESGYCPNKNGR